MDTRLPTLFLSHGSPMTALEGREAGAWWRTLGPAIDAAYGRPKAIVIASAHSLTREPVLLAAPRHAAVYDFGGFDPKLLTLRYDAPGAPALAERVGALLSAAGIAWHRTDEGGLDHGIWVPLRSMWPDADIPVLPLAWPPNASPAQLYQLGQALAPLADEGVLVIGSGSITHNLYEVFRSPVASPQSYAQEFVDWARNAVRRHDENALVHYLDSAPHAQRAHPTAEHYLPLPFAFGAAQQDAPVQVIDGGMTYSVLAMDAYVFGQAHA